MSLQLMANDCTSFYNMSSWTEDEPYCPADFDRISCWPPTAAGVRRTIPCSEYIFLDVNSDAYAARLCNNDSQWEERSHYELCMGCLPDDLNTTETFSIPPSYIIARKYFIICASALSITFLALGIFILLCNSRLRKYSRNILHVNLFLVFLLRSIIQIIAEVSMSQGYFSHNVFERVDVCNQTTIYFKEDHLVDCKLFTILMNYINSSVSHWFVFCEALYLYRLLRVKAHKDQVRWYILTGWLAPLGLTILTYSIRFVLKKDWYSCWFEPSNYDWILHGPNVVLQILNGFIFTYICTLLVQKVNKTYRVTVSFEHTRFSKYSRLTRSTLILLPLFSIHYFLFIWNTKPLLIPNLILIHLTVHTIASSVQGFLVALIYTIVNTEVQREILRSVDRCLARRCASWRQPDFFRDYINKLEDERLYSIGYQTRPPSIPARYSRGQGDILLQNYEPPNRTQQDPLNTRNTLAQELTLLNTTENQR